MSEEVKRVPAKVISPRIPSTRKHHRLVVAESTDEITYEVQHIPQKGEKIRNSRRRDHLEGDPSKIHGYNHNRPL